MKRVLSKNVKQIKKNFSEREIPKLRYGMFHSLFGDAEGVSIVMKQVEYVLNKHLKVPKRNVRYLVGKSGVKGKRITENEILSNKNRTNLLMLENYEKGYGGGSSERIEAEINRAKLAIERWVKKNKIDVLIAHNTSHPVNFIGSVALSRYYRDAIAAGKKTPKYVLWWHDSHLERKSFLHPAKDVENYLLEGVPGSLVEYIFFINSLQFDDANSYLKKLDSRKKGFFKLIKCNHDVMYNTTDTFINHFKDLESGMFSSYVDKFMQDFKVRDLLKKNKVSLKDTLFVLQHTRMVGRKRIDFALRYSYQLLSELRNKGVCKAMYFLVSGHNADGTKKELVKLNKQLEKEYGIDNLFLVFAEDYYSKTDLTFEEYPKIFAKLGAITTYFSDVEGFGNNLLEVLAAGLIPIVYTYPVFKKDIAKYKFNMIEFSEFELDKKKIDETVRLIKSDKRKKEWVNHNLRILKKHFPHSTMAVKLKQAIVSERTHI